MMRMISMSAALLIGAVLAPPVASADEWPACNNYQQSQAAIAACTRMIAAGTYKPLFHLYGARGVAYSWSGSYDRAIGDFNECIRLDPKDSICFGQRGIAYKLKGNRTQALADLQTAVALDATNQTAVTELEKLRAGR